MKKKVKKHIKKARKSSKKPVKKVKHNTQKKVSKKHPKEHSHKPPIYHVRKITKSKEVKQPKKVLDRRIASPTKIAEKPERDYDHGLGTPVYRHEYIKQFIEKSTNAYYGRLFSRIYDLVREKPKMFYKTLGLDLLILSILALMFRGSARFFPKGIAPFDVFGSFYIFTMAMLFFLLGILVYSLGKYKVLSVIESMLEGIKLNLERFDKFLILNCIIVGMWFLVFVILYAIGFISDALLRWLIWIAFGAISLFFYSFINISHWLFAHEPKFRKTMRRALIIMTDGFEKYVGVAGLLFVVLAAYSLIAFGIGWILTLADGDITIIKKIGIVIGIIILYTTMAYNRLCFYSVVRKLKAEIKD